MFLKVRFKNKCGVQAWNQGTTWQLLVHLICWGMDVRNQRIQTSLEKLSEREGQREGQVGHVGGTVKEWKGVGHVSVT